MPTVDPRDDRRFRNALGTFATGVAVVTTTDLDGRRFGMTINSFAAVSLEPRLVLWSLGRQSPSAAAFLASGHFAINVLAQSQLSLSRHFARPSQDKYEGIGTQRGILGAPLLMDAVAHFECSVAQRHVGGDHVILVGRVERYRHDDQPTLIFCRGRYQRGIDLEQNADSDAELATAWGGLA